VTDPVRRRTGAELEAALLEAAWAELVEVGYARLTMGSVATRARTSEPVLYRRWANKDQLVLAALEHQRRTHPVEPVDTGTLRGDLVAELTAVSRALAGFYAIAVATSYAGLLADTGLTPDQVRAQVMGRTAAPGQRPLYRRAAERGELDLDRVPAAVLAMPFELVRLDLVMGLKPPTTKRIASIVDELFLPLVSG
jgi:AcrR family transcriptional regulator